MGSKPLCPTRSPLPATRTTSGACCRAGVRREASRVTIPDRQTRRLACRVGGILRSVHDAFNPATSRGSLPLNILAHRVRRRASILTARVDPKLARPCTLPIGKGSWHAGDRPRRHRRDGQNCRLGGCARGLAEMSPAYGLPDHPATDRTRSRGRTGDFSQSQPFATF